MEWIMTQRKIGMIFNSELLPKSFRFKIFLTFFIIICILYYSLFENWDIIGRFQQFYSKRCVNLGQYEQDDPELAHCLRKYFLNPPSNLEYNLTNSYTKNPSQYEQNTYILHRLLGSQRNGFFVECGAFDGETYSNSLLLEKEFGWTGLLIEAEVTNYNKMVSKNRKAWTSHSCLSPKPYANKLTLVGIEYGENGFGGITLMNNSKPLQRFPGYVNSKRVPVQVQCFPLFTYLLALNRTVVDYLSLDVEGADYEILKTIPFDKVIFKVIEVEVHWVPEGKQEVRGFLEDRGYFFAKQISVDYIFVHHSVKY